MWPAPVPANTLLMECAADHFNERSVGGLAAETVSTTAKLAPRRVMPTLAETVCFVLLHSLLVARDYRPEVVGNEEDCSDKE